jgi:hypothetical protein
MARTPPPKGSAYQNLQKFKIKTQAQAQAQVAKAQVTAQAKYTANAQASVEKAKIRADAAAARRASRRPQMQGAPTVAGTILGSLVGMVLLLAITVSCGPLIDYFGNMMMNQPGNPYAAPIAQLFPWIYIFIFLSWVVYLVVIWRAVFRNTSFGVYD